MNLEEAKAAVRETINAMGTKPNERTGDNVAFNIDSDTADNTNPIIALNILAERHETLGGYHVDHSGVDSSTAQLHLKTAKWLRKAAKNVCRQGYFGCHGGANCDSDHK